MNWKGNGKSLANFSTIRLGKLYERSKICLITANGRGIRLKRYEVVVDNMLEIDQKLGWIELDRINEVGVRPVNVRQNGGGDGVDDSIYVCKAILYGESHPGKAYFGEFGTCYVGYGHREKREGTTAILVCKSDEGALIPPDQPDLG